MLGGLFQALAGPVSTEFRETYRVYPVSAVGKHNLESTDKLLLPASALHKIATLQVTYPLMFKTLNPSNGKSSHCGVMEFSSEEGVAYMPSWMMRNLGLTQGAYVSILNVTLQKGNFVKLQPHKMAFTMLSNPRVVLEKTLRNFSCLTKGDTIAVNHLNEEYLLDIVEVKPGNAVSIFETDVNVDFDPPKDAPPESERKQRKPSVKESKTPVVAPISEPVIEKELSHFEKLRQQSKGNSLTGKKRRTSSVNKRASPATKAMDTSNDPPPLPQMKGAARVERNGQYDYFYDKDDRLIRRLPVKSEKTASNFSAFKGKGNSLK